ncbi:Alpha-humulene synthase asR6 [Mycena sanguinolenta]|uniref:Alpha-humulene synthase asR6 n=1 Tax=Mycena sanguinolenta TaxID=230812 RepID=A0A8H6Y4F2_9AGAR|nr:Alpha-humulene synthase asR6 [Mycena sanguinolenta]
MPTTAHEELTLGHSPARQVMTLGEIWQTLKDYFGDGYIRNSAPFRFNVHLCETHRVAVHNENVFFGVHIDEDTMPLFGSLGETVKPPCTCEHIATVRQYIDDLVKTASIDDSYGIFSRKNEASVEETCSYAMRDSLQWWVHWHDGSVARTDYWKHLYIGIATSCDDILVPPAHLVDGTYRFLGHTASDIIAGLLSEGVDAENVRYMEMCLWRESVVQYFEKIDPKLRDLLLEKTHVMSQFHVASANTLGCAAATLAGRSVKFGGVEDEGMEMAAYGNCFSMGIAKEALGIAQGEPTEPTAGWDRNQLNAELRWMYARVMGQLDTHELVKYLRRYASSSLYFVGLNDRYLERMQGRRRRMLTPQMQALIASYTVGPSGRLEVNVVQQEATEQDKAC